MSNPTRAWKDPAFRVTLSDAELATLPASPVGMVEQAEGELELVFGADHRPWTFHSCFTCGLCGVQTLITCGLCGGW